MPKYRVVRDVESAHGTQCYVVDAASPEEACRLADEGHAEFEYEEIEVQSLGKAHSAEVVGYHQ
jgi:hypothetical protein